MGTAIMHGRESPVDRGVEDSGRATSRTNLAKDAAYGGWRGMRQEEIIEEIIK